MRALTKLALTAAAGAGLGVLATNRSAGRLRHRSDPAVDPLLVLPDDVTERQLRTADGASLHLIERGQGRPLVLLHGVTLAASIWAPQFHQLAGSDAAPGFRVIALDLRGHAGSTVGSDGWGLPALADDLAQVLNQLDLRGAIVAGHSMGGMTLMQFCADHPDVLADRVAGLVFVATAAQLPLHPLIAERARILRGRLIDRLDRGRRLPHRVDDSDVSLLICRLAFGRAPSAAAVEQVRACVEAMEPESFHRSWLGLLDHDVRSTLPSVTVPAEIVVGSRDLLTPVSSARLIARLLPHAGFTVLADAGHQLMQERPDELAEILRGLAARVSKSAPAGNLC